MASGIPPPPPLLPVTFSKIFKENEHQENIWEITRYSTEHMLQEWLKLRQGKYFAYWSEVEAVLQNGPQCGLVCLAMAAGIPTAVPEIFKRAKEMGFTKQGEMFSASNMQLLAQSFQLQAQLFHDGLEPWKIIHALLQHKRILVPYDADSNHEPCLREGKKAHWALIFGFVIQDTHCGDRDGAELLTVKPDSAEKLLKKLDQTSLSDKLHFLVRQGKSKRLGIWKFQSLYESNLNLKQVDPKRTNPNEYVVPHDLSTLCGKYLFVFSAPVLP